MKTKATVADLRVQCPVCKGAATCMLCDDNGLVPVSSVNGGERTAQHAKPSRIYRDDDARKACATSAIAREEGLR